MFKNYKISKTEISQKLKCHQNFKKKNHQTLVLKLPQNELWLDLPFIQLNLWNLNPWDQYWLPWLKINLVGEVVNTSHRRCLKLNYSWTLFHTNLDFASWDLNGCLRLLGHPRREASVWVLAKKSWCSSIQFV